MALFPMVTGGGTSDIVEDGYAIFNNSYIDLTNATPNTYAVIFAHVEKFSNIKMSISGSAAYSDTKFYSYDESSHSATQLTSAQNINISNVKWLLVNKYAATVLTFS